MLHKMVILHKYSNSKRQFCKRNYKGVKLPSYGN